MEKIKNTKVLGIIGNAIIIVSLFCTWAVAETKGLNLRVAVQLIEGSDGKWELVLSIVSLIIIFSDKIPLDFLKRVSNMKFTLIPTIIQLIIIINNLSRINRINSGSISYHFGIGFYLLIIGIVALFAFPFVYKQEEKTI